MRSPRRNHGCPTPPRQSRGPSLALFQDRRPETDWFGFSLFSLGGEQLVRLPFSFSIRLPREDAYCVCLATVQPIDAIRVRTN